MQHQLKEMQNVQKTLATTPANLEGKTNTVTTLTTETHSVRATEGINILMVYIFKPVTSSAKLCMCVLHTGSDTRH